MIEVALIALFVAPSWIFAFLYLHFGIYRHIRSPEMALLNQNLSKVGMFWSESAGDFRLLNEGSAELDREKMYRTFFIMTAFLSLLSFIGMLLLILIFVSGRPRLERNAFNSELARNRELTPAEVQALVNELRSFV